MIRADFSEIKFLTWKVIICYRNVLNVKPVKDVEEMKIKFPHKIWLHRDIHPPVFPIFHDRYITMSLLHSSSMQWINFVVFNIRVVHDFEIPHDVFLLAIFNEGFSTCLYPMELIVQTTQFSLHLLWHFIWHNIILTTQQGAVFNIANAVDENWVRVHLASCIRLCVLELMYFFPPHIHPFITEIHRAQYFP